MNRHPDNWQRICRFQVTHGRGLSMIMINRMHRQVAATVFVVVVLIFPTLATLWWAWAINRPGHVRDVEVQLSRSLGLQVGLDSVRYPRPGEMVLIGPVFRQEEPRGRVFREVARARMISIRPLEEGRQIEVLGLQLVGDSAETGVAQLAQLLQKSSVKAGEGQRLAFSVDRCEILVEQGASGKPVRTEWRTVAGLVDARQEQSFIQASGWMYNADERTRCEFKMTRKRQGEQASSQIEIATMEGPALPAKVLEPLLNTSGWLGENAKVLGQLTLRQVEQAPWDAQFTGTFEDVDLSQLVTGRFGPYRLLGEGRVQIKRAHWADRPEQGPGWCEVQGELTSGPGKISHGLLLSMGQQMKFRIIPDWIRASKPGEIVEFGGIGLQFHLTDDGLIRFAGACGPDFGRDVVAVSGTAAHPKPVVAAPSGIVTVRGLIKTLFPVDLAQAELLVPTTRESQALQRYLPMPVERIGSSQVLPTSHQ